MSDTGAHNRHRMTQPAGAGNSRQLKNLQGSGARGRRRQRDATIRCRPQRWRLGRPCPRNRPHLRRPRSLQGQRHSWQTRPESVRWDRRGRAEDRRLPLGDEADHAVGAHGHAPMTFPVLGTRKGRDLIERRQCGEANDRDRRRPGAAFPRAKRTQAVSFRVTWPNGRKGSHTP